MAFQVVKTFVVQASADTVWQFLIDPHQVARCLPGAAITGQVDDKTFTGTMTVKVGPVTTSYKGKVVFQKLDAAAHAAEVMATGQDLKGKGGASMKLTSSLKQLAPGETEITAISDLSVTGLLAQMGRGMIQDVGDELFSIFSRRVKSELEARGAPAQAVAASAAVDAVPAAPASSAAAPAAAAERAAPVVPPAEVPPEALDLGSIGTRAALRALGRPTFWIVLAVVVGLVYVLFIR